MHLRYLIVFVCLITLAIGLAVQVEKQKTPSVAAEQPSPVITADSFYTNFADLALVNQDNQPFQAEELLGHVTLFNFIFTHCAEVCPIQTRSLVSVFNKLPADIKDKVRFVSVSIDPKVDTPEQLKLFSETLEADKPQWQFLTGEPVKVDKAIESLALISEVPSPVAGQINHNTNLWLVDPKGILLIRYDGRSVDEPRIVRELTQLVEMTTRTQEKENNL